MNPKPGSNWGSQRICLLTPSYHRFWQSMGSGTFTAPARIEIIESPASSMARWSDGQNQANHVQAADSSQPDLWIGQRRASSPSSRPVALKHYLRVTDSDFEKAAEGRKIRCSWFKAVQYEGQHSAARLGSIAHETSQHTEGCSLMRDDFLSCPQVQNTEVTPTGLEPVLPP